MISLARLHHAATKNTSWRLRSLGPRSSSRAVAQWPESRTVIRTSLRALSTTSAYSHARGEIFNNNAKQCYKCGHVCLLVPKVYCRHFCFFPLLLVIQTPSFFFISLCWVSGMVGWNVFQEFIRHTKALMILFSSNLFFSNGVLSGFLHFLLLLYYTTQKKNLILEAGYHYFE